MLNTWTEKDDERLAAAVNVHLETTNQVERFLNMNQLVLGFSWDKISTLMQSKSSKECRERFLIHVSPKTHKTSWSIDEMEFLSLLRQKYSSNVQKILEHFPCRLEQDIISANHVQTLKRKSEAIVEDDFFNSVIKPMEKKFCAAFQDIIPEYNEQEFEALLTSSSDMAVDDNFPTDASTLISCF